MENKDQTQLNLMFGITVLLIGGILVVLWAFGEVLPSTPLTAIGKWGLGILIIAIEIIQTIIKGGFK